MLDRTKAPATKPFGHLHLPAPTVETLANGLTFSHYSGNEQNICQLKIKIPVGAANARKAITALLAQQLTKGTKNYPPALFAETLDFYGANINACASAYYITISIRALTDRLPALMPLVTEMLSAPLFDPERVENAKRTAINKILTSRRDPAVLAWDAIRPLMHGEGHPSSIIIEPEDIEAVTPAALDALFAKMANPAKFIVMLAGGLTESVVNTVRDELSKIEALGDGYNKPEYQLRPAPGGTRIVTPFADSLQSAIVMVIPCPKRNNPDYIPLRLAILALGGYFGSRLMSNIREEKGLTYSIDACLQGFPEGSFAIITAKCDKKFTQTVEQETIKEIERLVTEPPTGEELENLRLYAMTSLAKTLDSPLSIIGYYNSKLEAGYKNSYFDEQQRVIKSLTSDMIADVASRYLKPGNIITSIAGND